MKLLKADTFDLENSSESLDSQYGHDDSINEQLIDMYEQDTLLIDRIISDIREIRYYLNILDSFGYNDNTTTFLKSSFETFNGVDFSQYTEEDIRAIIDSKLQELDSDLGIAFEGWLSDVLARTAYAFKSDKGVSKKIRKQLDSLKRLSPEKFDKIINKPCKFGFYTPDNLRKMIAYVTKGIDMLKDDEEIMRKSDKLFVSTDVGENAIQRIRMRIDTMNEEYKNFRRDAILAKGSTESEKASPISFGWDRNTIISVVESWLNLGAGKFDSIKLLKRNIERWAYMPEHQTLFGSITGGNRYGKKGGVTLDGVEIKTYLREEYRNVVVFLDEVVKLYESVDGSIYRFMKRF